MKKKQEGPVLVRAKMTLFFADKKYGWALGDDNVSYIVRKSDGCLPQVVGDKVFRASAPLKKDPAPGEVIIFEPEKTAEGNMRAKQWCRTFDYDKAAQAIERKNRQPTLAGIS